MNIEPDWMKDRRKPVAAKLPERIRPEIKVGQCYQYKKEKVKVIEHFEDDLFCTVVFKTGKLKGREVQAVVAQIYFLGEKEEE